MAHSGVSWLHTLLAQEPQLQPQSVKDPSIECSPFAPSGVNSVFCWELDGYTYWFFFFCYYQYSIKLEFPFLKMNSQTPSLFYPLGIKESGDQQASDSLKFAPPRKILGLALVLLPRSGVGLSSGWFQGALHFVEEKREDQKLNPAVPCQGHPLTTDSGPRFLLQNRPRLPSPPTVLSPLLSAFSLPLPTTPKGAL